MNQDKTFLGTEPVGKLLLKLSVPTVIAQLVNMLYNICLLYTSTLFGALYLAIVAIMPILVGIIIGNSSLGIGGTSVIIVVGVALETVKALEAQMLMRHYKGFLE